MYEVKYILGGNIELDVQFSYAPGKPMVYGQTNETGEPAEDDEIEIDFVYCGGLEVDIDDIYIGGDGAFTAQTLEADILDFISTNREEWTGK